MVVWLGWNAHGSFEFTVLSNSTVTTRSRLAGPAAGAGLRSVTGQTQSGQHPDGDVIVQIGSEKIEDPDDVSRVVNRHKPGDVIDVVVMRDGHRDVHGGEDAEDERLDDADEGAKG